MSPLAKSMSPVKAPSSTHQSQPEEDLLKTTPNAVKTSSSNLQNQPLSKNSMDPVEEYKEALFPTDGKKDCQKLKTLSETPSFVLKELALIRLNQYCEKKPQWEKLRIKNKFLETFLYQAWFDSEISKNRFGNAYRVFDKNRKWVKMDNRKFGQMATKALETKLTSDEKTRLRLELQKKSPRFIPHPKKKDFIRVAHDYRRNRQFEKALSYYRKVINDPKFSYNQRWKAFKGARRTYKLQRQESMDKYIKASKQWARFLRKQYHKSPRMAQLHHVANIEYARTLWTERGQKEARSVLDQLEKELKGHYSLQIVYWLRGKMAEEKKQYKQSVSWFEKASREKSLSDRYKQKVLWSLAWNQRRIRKFETSQQNLELLTKDSYLTSFKKAKYLYWQAENFESMGKGKKAKNLFRDLVDLDLYGYYGSLAHRKLQIPFSPMPKPKWDQEDLLKFFKKEDSEFFLALIQSGEWNVAKAMVLKKVKMNKNRTTEEWAHYIALLHKTRAYRIAFRYYHRLPVKKQRLFLENHGFLLFPQPYKETVAKAAMKSRISPALIYSIMKQESGFNTKARSPADAFGLLQMIPKVAKTVSRSMASIQYKNPEDLYKPEVIIPLGAEYLSRLLSKFDNHFILSVASYNSTEKAVLGWIQNHFHGDPIAFIEDIPYKETKTYIKLVMKNYIAYLRMDSKQKDLPFPEFYLQGLEKFKNQ